MKTTVDLSGIGNLYFKSSSGELVLLAENINHEDAIIKMKEFRNEHNYKSYYTRVWRKDNVIWYDIGSWSEYFCLKINNEDGDKDCDTN